MVRHVRTVLLRAHATARAGFVLFFLTSGLGLFGASHDQIEAWKKTFPAVNNDAISKAPKLAEIASGYRWLVGQSTPTNLD